MLTKFFYHQPIEWLSSSWKLMGLDLASSTMNAGLERLEPMFTPIYTALQERNRLSPYQQADETRWLVFVEKEKRRHVEGHRWWLWVFNGIDTSEFVLDPYRSHDVPQGLTCGVTSSPWRRVSPN